MKEMDELYARIVVSLPWHEKILGITERDRAAAFGYYVAACCFCQEQLSDGFIRTAELVKVFPDKRYDRLVRTLMDAELFERADNGFLVHDYLDVNKSRAEVLAERKQKRDAGRRGGKASAQARAQAPAKAAATADAQAKSNPDTDTDTDTDTEEHQPPEISDDDHAKLTAPSAHHTGDLASFGDLCGKPMHTASWPPCMLEPCGWRDESLGIPRQENRGRAILALAAWRWPGTFAKPVPDVRDMTALKAAISGGCIDGCDGNAAQCTACFNAAYDAITDPRNEESSWSSRRGLFAHRMLPDSRGGDRLCVTS